MGMTELFSKVDDFCQLFEPKYKKLLLSSEKTKRDRKTSLSFSKMVSYPKATQTRDSVIYNHSFQYEK